MAEVVSFSRQLGMFATERGDETAIVHVGPDGAEHAVSWRDLDRRANQVARLLQSRGVGQGSTVIVALPNTPQHFFADFAAWRLGATVLPLRWDLPSWERDRLLDLASPTAVVGSWADAAAGTLSPDDVDASVAFDDGELPDRVPDPVRVIATSGSTGRPKLIVIPVAGVVGADTMSQAASVIERPERITELVISPLYHTNGFNCLNSLLEGRRLVVMQRFDAALAVGLIERHRVNTAIMVPTMLQRIAELPDVSSRNFASINAILYGGAPLPQRVAQAWFDLVGPEHFVFSYGGTESIGLTLARGDEWLEHVGTVGRPVTSDLKIVGDDGTPLPAGSIGSIYMRRNDGTPVSRYIGAADLEVDADGFTTLGDLGWVDEDGYLYLADRRVDMIVTGGANVYPAEVELALAEHRSVADVVVVGLPDDEWGHRVHAIVQPVDTQSPPAPEELRAHVRAMIAAYKVPKSIEIVELIPRTDAGKINRAALAAQRL